MKKILPFLLSFCLVVSQFCSTVGPLMAQAQKSRIAIFPFEDANKGAKDVEYGSAISNMLMTALITGGRFNVVERAQIMQILDEQSLGVSGALDSQTARELGKILGVDFLVFGSVAKFGDLVEVDLRLVSQETGEAIKAVNESSRGEDDIRQMVNRLAKQLEGKKPSEEQVQPPVRKIPEPEKAVSKPAEPGVKKKNEEKRK